MTRRERAEIAFQSTHPRGVRLLANHEGMTCETCFNPRTRVGCDAIVLINNIVVGTVSIHAPAWGATASWLTGWARSPVSIHAPAWGATSGNALSSRGLSSFNPRTRVGCDAGMDAVKRCAAGFNPRTRVGCDNPLRWHDQGQFCFNPRTRVGCDTLSKASGGRDGHVSIHAPAWGATPCVQPCSRRCRCFNPRTRVGCDAIAAAKAPAVVRVSIHAPAWGATGGLALPTIHADRLFQSTHPRGVRPPLIFFIINIAKFQSTHPRGVRRNKDTAGVLLKTFQSTHPRGVRQLIAPCLDAGGVFQSTHPRGVRQ